MRLEDGDSAYGGIAALIVAYAFIFFVALSPEHAWMQPELIPIKRHIVDNIPWAPSAILRETLHGEVFEAQPHRLTRPLSSFVEIVDTKFRSALWRIMTPHPSLSLTLLLTLILQPFALYALLMRCGVRAGTAYWSLAFYLLQPSTLSHVSMLFRPAKPLANTILVCALWLASTARISNGKFALLCALLITGFLCDETTVVALIALPLIFSRNLFITGRRIAVYCAVPLMVAVAWFLLLPRLSAMAGFATSNFAEYEIFANWRFLYLKPAPTLAASLLDLGLVFGESIGLQDLFAAPWLLKPVIAIHGAIFLLLLASLYRWSKASQSTMSDEIRVHGALLSRSSAAIALFALLHAFLMQMTADRVTGRIWGPYWYASYLPVFFAMAFAMVCELLRSCRWIAIFRVTLLVMLMLTFPSINRCVRTFHYYPYAPRLVEDVYSGLINRHEVTGPEVDRARSLEMIRDAAERPGTPIPKELPREFIGVAIEAGLHHE